MRKSIFLTLMVLLVCSCHQTVNQQKTSQADSLITATLETGDDDRVLALVDSLEACKSISALKANFRRGYAYERKGMRYYTELYWKKVLDEKNPSDDDLASYIHAATFLANRQVTKNDFEGAIRTASEALKRIDKSQEQKPLFKAMLLQVVGSCQTELEQAEAADETMNEAFDNFLLALKTDTTDYSMRNTIIGLSNIAKDYLEVKQPEKATMWYHRADSLLNVFKTYPDAKEEKIDKMQALLLQLKIKIAGANKDKEAAAKAFEEYQETAYSKTQDGRWKMINYLMKNKRFDEAADIYMLLDSRMSQKNGGLSLDNIRKHYVGKFKANVQAGRKDSAWVVAEKVMMALDSAVNAFQQSEMAELTTMYQTQQKEAEIARQQVEISSQRFIGLVVVLLLITTFFVIYSMYRRKALHQIALAKAAKERMESELRIARDIQMSMVPHEFPKLEGLDIFASMTPAREVGGDLYDYIQIDNVLYFCVGDVSGKGVPASLVMAQVTRLFRALAKQRMMPEEIATRLNDELTENNKSGMFVTMFIALVDLTTGHLDYCNAGHNPPVLGGDAEGGSFMKIHSNAPIGLWSGLKFVGEEIDTIKGRPMFLYTDGLNEAENPQRQQFGEERMLKILRSIRFESATKVISTLSREVEQHRNGAEPNDDLTMFCFKIR